jgi:alkylhydroperoxidase/carboxymuconolactone decarboxylase family protein YurZ
MSQNPEVEVMLNKMRAGMGKIPTAIEKVAEVDESLLFEHMRSSGYAMPPDGALDTQTRTLIYLAAALAAAVSHAYKPWRIRQSCKKSPMTN